MNHAALYALLGAVGVAIVAVALAVWKRSSAPLRPLEHQHAELRGAPAVHPASAAATTLDDAAVPAPAPAPFVSTPPAAAPGAAHESLAETPAPAAEAALPETVELWRTDGAEAPLASDADAATPDLSAPTLSEPSADDAATLAPSADDATALAPSAGTLEIVEIRQSVRGDDVGEWVLLRNGSGALVELHGWRLTDEGDKHTYTFPACALAPAGELRVHMWSGDDTLTDLYVGRKQPWWNNAGDTAYLFDAAGTLIVSLRYDAAPTGG
jgi:hypothetical protein